MSDAKRRVLVVDDEQSVVMLCGFVLEDAGYEVETATTAVEAIRLIREKQFDAFLIDLVMPQAGGFAAIHAARNYRAGIPVIVMTAEPEHLVPKRAGMDYYLHKPFAGLSALENVVNRAVGGLPPPVTPDGDRAHAA